MADRIPVKAIYSGTYGSSDVTSLGELASGETINGSYITDNTIDEANLKVSNTPTNGYVLTAQSAVSGGLTWASDTDTDTTYSAGDGLDKSVGNAFSLDLKASGGLAIDTTELKLDLTQDQSWTGSQRATIVANTTGSFDMNGGNNFKCTVSTGTITITFTNITDGQSGFILLVNSGATMAAAGTTKVDANLLATVTAAGTYLISYLSDGTNVYLTNSAIYT